MNTTEAHVNAFNALLSAGAVVFQKLILERMPPDQAAQLRNQINGEGWRVRMILEDGACIVQMYRGEQVQHLMRATGKEAATVN